MATDNIPTWDWAALVPTLVDGLEVDFSRLLIFVIHERDFKASITYLFQCMVYPLCRDAGMPIWQRCPLYSYRDS